MEKRYIEFIQDVLITIHQNIHELQDRKGFADPSELTHIEAKLLAYQEILAIIKVSATEFNLPQQEIGF
jgi:hypothetical protein